MSGFNYRLMPLARDARDMTQAELSARTRIGQGTLSKYETGVLPLPEDAIKVISDTLDYPVSFFLQDEQTYGFPPFHFRRRKKLGTRMLNSIIADMNIRRMHVKKLLLSYESEQAGVIPEVDLDEYQGNSRRRATVEDLARHLREAWMVPAGPIENMVELIERNGGIVVPCDFGTDLIDAMSQRIDGMPVLFFINKNAPADRVRHTLAHELGHMLLHTLSLRDDEVMESEADMFAGAFLVPADEFIPQIRQQFSLRHLANLKSYWKVSMAALAMRADRLRLISPHQKKRFFIEMGMSGYRTHEPNEPPAESPKKLNRMVRFHQTKLDYTAHDLARLLNLFPHEFNKIYGHALLERPAINLRLVK